MNKKSRFQMADLAELAGFSKSTVSRALADSPLVNSETKEFVRKLARENNYRLNTAARNFRLKEILTFAVLLPGAEHSDWAISDPFFLDMLGSIAEALEVKGHQLLLPGIKPSSFERISDFSHSQMVDGVILIGQGSQHQQLKEFSKEYLAISVWGASMDDPQNYPTVGTDNELGGYRATKHLLDRGRSNLLFLGYRDVPEIRQRYAGFQKALAEAGIESEEKRCLNVFDLHRLIELENELTALQEIGIRFDGAVAATDLQAMAAIRALSHLGMKVPDDCAIVGYDDIEIAAHYNPPLTTIHQSRAEGGRLLVDNVLAALEGRVPENVVLDPQLIVRKSS